MGELATPREEAGVTGPLEDARGAALRELTGVLWAVSKSNLFLRSLTLVLCPPELAAAALAREMARAFSSAGADTERKPVFGVGRVAGGGTVDFVGAAPRRLDLGVPVGCLGAGSADAMGSS